MGEIWNTNLTFWKKAPLDPPFTLALRNERPTTNELKGLHVYFRYLVVRKTSTNMGSFIGHAVPGAFFTLAALWWTFNIFWRYFAAHFNQLHHGAKKGGAYKNTVSFSCDILCPKMFVCTHYFLMTFLFGFILLQMLRVRCFF